MDIDTPMGRALGNDLSTLRPLFVTAVERTRWLMEESGAQVEVVLDRGTVQCDARSAPLCEVELELRAGPPAALFAIARRIDRDLPVRPAVLSKAERGHLLRGPAADAVKAEAVNMDPALAIRDAFLAIAGACLRHYRRNESVLLRHYEARALHQARVAIRRLRSALTLFKPVLLEADVARFQQELRWLAAVLGEARDLDVLQRRLDAVNRKALAEPLEQSHISVGEWLESARVRALLLDIAEWLALGAGCGGPADEPVRDFAAERLERLHRKVVKHGDNLADLPADARHRIRKDAKKLRYGSEFFAALYRDGKLHRRYVRALEKLQDELGDLNDLATAPIVLARHGLAPDTRLGLKPEKKLLKKAQKARDGLARAKWFWR